MIHFLARQVLYPLHEILQGRKTLQYMKTMEKTQWLDYEELQKYQWNKLQKLIRHSAKTVPYYRRLYAEIGLDPESFTPEDFRRIPVMEKEIFKENEQDIVSSDYGNDELIRLRTGSSTGSPLWFYSCKQTQAFQNGAKLRCRRWWAIEPGDMMFEFWASPIELSKRGKITVVKDQLLLNHFMLSALNMTPEVMTEYVNLMNKKKPRVIVGYPSAMNMLAQHIRSEKLKLNFTPKGIVVTAEVLLQSQRELIQEIFQAPVINEYGARDGGLLAYECPEGSMHIVAENVYLEIDEQTAIAGDSQSGDVLVTNLDSFAYPFIRYRLGDQVTLTNKQCKCGRGLPCLENIEGRKTDWLTDRTGKNIHGLVVAHTIGKVQGIRQFQIIQKKPEELIIKIAKNNFYEEKDDEYVVLSLEKYFSSPMSIKIEHVDKIEASPSGKHRFIINEVNI
jgi:phenylacetate-CoA ligase